MERLFSGLFPALFIACAGIYLDAQVVVNGGRSAAQPVVTNINEIAPVLYDAGRMKFIAVSSQTNGTMAVVELIEMPGYKTAWHQHNNCEETFYVLEGTLTIKIRDKQYELKEGSFVFIPRGTPHGQGNFSNKRVRLLTTFTPGGFDLFFQDRVELFKSTKPKDPGFQNAFEALRKKHNKWVEILGTWESDRRR